MNNFKSKLILSAIFFNFASTTAVLAMNCVDSGLHQTYTRTVSGVSYDVYPLAKLKNESLDDWGSSGINDALQFFCSFESDRKESKDPEPYRIGTVNVCLSGELCPWR